MGDLILSFPLFATLRAAEPERPVWVVAEERFFKDLLPFAPDVVFFPSTAAPRLTGRHFRRIINLSHREDAARLCAELPAEERFGPLRTPGGNHISGWWQLYRASVVHNNRHNRFHWADLNLLDLVRPEQLRRMQPREPRPAGGGRVGLFVGASEEAKRPLPAFWGELAAELARRGLHPVLLGGPEDSPLAAEAARLSGMPRINLCGRFDLRAFAEFVRELDLFVVPDTGPMHLAAWLGAPVLNLSLGPVQAWETGPTAPGHHVLRSGASCSGCWACARKGQPCRAPFAPKRAALVAHTLLKESGRLPDLRLPGLEILVTARTSHGLHDLRRLTPRAPNAREALGTFWRAWFLERSPQKYPPDAARAARDLAVAFPRLPAVMSRATARCLHHCAHAARAGEILPPDFWKTPPPLFRPLSGHAQIFLQNEEYSKTAWEKVLTELEDFSRLLSPLSVD